MSKYDDLRKEAESAREAFGAYENDCLRISRELLSEVRTQLGCSRDALDRIENPKNLPAGVLRTALHEGWFDLEGRYAVFIRFQVAPITIETTLRIFKDADTWHVSIARIEPAALTTKMSDAAQYIGDALTAMVRETSALHYPTHRRPPIEVSA